jgi:hypothetical protein
MLSVIHEVLRAGSAEDRLYFVGYKGLCLSRRLRRLIAGSAWHRAWLCGHLGLYEEDGMPFGTCDRQGYRYRSRNVPTCVGTELLRVVLRPHAH